MADILSLNGEKLPSPYEVYNIITGKYKHEVKNFTNSRLFLMAVVLSCKKEICETKAESLKKFYCDKFKYDQFNLPPQSKISEDFKDAYEDIENFPLERTDSSSNVVTEEPRISVNDQYHRTMHLLSCIQCVIKNSCI